MPLISMFSLLLCGQIKPQEGKNKEKREMFISLLFYFTFIPLLLFHSFFRSFSFSRPHSPPILSLSLCFSLILSAFRYFSVSSYLSFNHPFWVTRNFQSDRESKALPTGGRQMDTCHESLQSPLSKFVFLVIIIIIMISIVLIIAIIILVFVFLSDKCTNRRKLF